MWFALKNEDAELIVLMESSCTGKVLCSSSDWWVIDEYYVIFVSQWLTVEALPEKEQKFWKILDAL